MSNMIPVAVYGLTVPAGDVMIPAMADFPATFRITMAAIDPSAAPEHTGTANGNTKSRATLKLVYDPRGPGGEDDSEEGSEDEEEILKAIMEGRGSEDEDEDEDDEEDEESSSEDEEKNGGPSDPSKTKKARQEAALQQMMKTLADSKDDSEDDVDMDDAPKTNGAVGKSAIKSNKGKGKALAEASDDEESEEDSEASLDDLDEQVVCTLDPEKTYQQPLDITIPEDQRAYFKVSGTHAIYLTGNYVIPADDGHSHNLKDDSEDYDMSPDEDSLDLIGEDESDELDDMEDPRITEVVSEKEEEPPKLIKKAEPTKKGKNKRAHEESPDAEAPAASLDDIMAKSLKPAEPTVNGTANGIAGGEPKLSKKQLKKLKNNAGKAVEAALENKDVKKADNISKENDSQKGDKKVQFAKNLEQGPSASPSIAKADTGEKVKTEAKKDDGKPKASLGMKTVAGGVKIDDKKLGKGPAAKKGSKVGMRYIGKLQDGKVFDANKSGKPFSFTLGEGSVIKGWDVGVAGMSVGGERRITVPAEMAYGKKGAPPDIPPNSELIFDLKMLEVK